MLRKDKNTIKLHERLFKDIARHIDASSFESVSAFVHHVMADICSTGDLALGGDIPKAEADLVRKRLEALGYLASENGKPLVAPHGGLTEPVNRQVSRDRLDELIHEAKGLNAYQISKLELPVLYRFGDGVLSPLEGPMIKEDFDRSLDEGVLLRDGVSYAWPIPLAFRVSEAQAKTIKSGNRLAVIDDKNDIVGILTVEEVYPFDRERYLKSVYGTVRTDHAGARQAMEDHRDWLLGGKVE
ncbi:MAG: hypothetical protein KJ645_04580, partial [Planctomycetes bacterium]|nr:hypothetical protein [Planctomycetota bacterium]